MKTIEHKLFLERIVKPIATNLYQKKELDTNVFYLAGSRTGGKTRLLFFLISLILNFYNKDDELLKADCYFFRSTKDATKESFGECLDNWHSELDVLESNVKDKIITNKLNNRVHFVGADILNTVRQDSANSGLGMRDDRELVLIVVEEAQQINLDQLKNAMISVRSNKDTKFLYIYSLNPTNSSCATVKKAIEVCKPKLHLLKQQGFCLDRKQYKYWLGNECFIENTECIWNNFLTCKDEHKNWLISKQKIMELLQLARDNPEKAVCDVWGFPFSPMGLVYKNMNKAIISPVVNKYKKITAGCDLAGGHSKDSAINTLVITGWLNNYQCEVIAECEFNQKDNPTATISNKAKYFLNWMYAFLEDYKLKTNLYDIELDVRVDFGGGIGGDMLTEFNNLNICDYISFQSCSKKCRGNSHSDITNRITIVNDAINFGNIKFFNSCEKTIEQMESIEYVRNTRNKERAELIRSDRNNDYIDAFEYSICYEWQDIKINHNILTL